jgi:uncharacterized membrane protein
MKLSHNFLIIGFLLLILGIGLPASGSNNCNINFLTIAEPNCEDRFIYDLSSFLIYIGLVFMILSFAILKKKKFPNNNEKEIKS